jgi:hypothetical protein
MLITRSLTQLTLAAFALSAVAVAQPADGSFQVRYATNLTTKASGTIYSTDGVPPTFNSAAASADPVSTNSACVSSVDNNTAYTYLAFQFTAAQSGIAQTYMAALSSATVNYLSTANFQLVNDVAGSPGVTVLDSFTFSGIGGSAAVLSAASTTNAVLQAGTAYWMKALPPTCDNANTLTYRWHFSNPPVAGRASVGLGGFATTVMEAFAVIGFNTGESQILFSNTGANNAGDLCVSAYVFAPDEQLVSCCSCKVTRNALGSALVGRDLTSNTLTPAKENSVVVKLLATAAAGANCDAANPGLPASGLAAWMNTFHLSNGLTGRLVASETPFTNSRLSTAELNVMTGLCGFIKSNGSGYGICNICRPILSRTTN